MTVKSKPGNEKPPRPDKPYPGFPLTAHPNGQWCKRVKNKLHYFGPWNEPQAALAEWERCRDFLMTGRVPPPRGDGVTVELLVNLFLDSKQAQLEAGRISPRSFKDYYRTGMKFGQVLGRGTPLTSLRPEDFRTLLTEIASTRSVTGQVGEITRARMIVKFASDADLVDRPIVMGPDFRVPSKRQVRIALAARPSRLFSAAEVRRLLARAPVDLAAMILLGVNCGFGNSDVGNLPLAAVDLARGWIEFPRPKTGIERRAKLWPETVSAIRVYLEVRREPHHARDAGILFITRKGHRWAKQGLASPLTRSFALLAGSAKVELCDRGFYDLRHTFATEAGQACDQEAVNFVMGHAPNAATEIPGRYRHRVDDARLVRIARHVRRWLFSSGKSTKARRSIRQGGSPRNSAART